MIIFVIIITVVILLYLLVPKGYVVYEGLRFPAWSFKMKRFPNNGLVPEKHPYGDHPRQYLIHYKPKTEEKSKQQVVIYIHGGGWQFGNPEMFRPNAQVLDKLGYHSFFLSHRRIPRYNILSMKSDVAKGMEKVKEVMQQEGVAARQIVLGGVSSGANLAALFYYDRELHGSAGYTYEHFAGLFLMAPPLNLRDMWPSPTLRFLAGKRGNPLFQEANPIDYLEDEHALPTLIVHPEKDGMVPLRSTERFIEKAQAMGYPNLVYHVLPDMTHMDAASWCFEDHPSYEIFIKWIMQIKGLEEEE